MSAILEREYEIVYTIKIINNELAAMWEIRISWNSLVCNLKMAPHSMMQERCNKIIFIANYICVARSICFFYIIEYSDIAG